MNAATWTNGKRTVHGKWSYYWPAKRFDIILDSYDRVTGCQRRISTYGERPEWGNWKYQQKEVVRPQTDPNQE